MWWGGSEGAEAAAEAVEAAPEIEDMKEQFDMQQNLIKQLKDMVKTHQSQLQEKEQQVQRLSRAEHEQTSKLDRLSQQVAALEEEAPANQSTASTSGAQGRRERMLEIKRRLEEQRRVQEERSQERRVDLETMVRNLQSRIEDTDYCYDSCDSADSGSDGDVDYGSSPRKSMTLSDSVRGKEPEELYGVILAKDNRIYELSDKVAQLEATVVDLKDTLQEKESVISARTAAVNLVTRALTERGQVTLETLDDTRQQMTAMQEAFAVHEADWRVREERLTRQLQEANQRLEASEENYKKAESTRFDLVIANANLQEKLVKLQASAKDEAGRAAALESELAEVKRELADSQKMVFRVKSQKRQRVSQLEAESDQLTARCAELQQLSDELREQLRAASERIEDKDRLTAELEAKIAELVSATDEKDTLVSKLTSEKTNLELQVTALTSSLEEARVGLDQASTSLAETRAELEETRASLEQTATSLSETNARLVEATASLREERDGSEATTAELREARAGLEEARAELERVRADRDVPGDARRLEEAEARHLQVTADLEERLRVLGEAAGQALTAEMGSQADRQITAEVGSQARRQSTAEMASQAEKQVTAEAASQADKLGTAETGSQAEKQVTAEMGSQAEVGGQPESQLTAEAVSEADCHAATVEGAQPETPAVKQLEARLEVLMTDLDTSRRMLEESQMDREALRQEAARLQQLVSGLETELKASEGFFSELQFSSKQLQEQLDNEKSEREAMRNEYEARNGDLKKMVKKLKTKLKQELKAKSSLEEKVGILKQKVRAQLSQEKESRQAADGQLTEARSALESMQARSEPPASVGVAAGGEKTESAQQPMPVQEAEAESQAAGTASETKQKMKLMKVKLRKELQLKAELQKELSGVKQSLDETRSELHDVRSNMAEETSRTHELVMATETELRELRNKLSVAENEFAQIVREKEALSEQLQGAAVERLQAEVQGAAGGEAPLSLPERCVVLAQFTRLLCQAALERRPRAADLFELPLLRATDRSSSQSSLLSERSESARSEPMRDEAVAKVRTLEEAAQALRARLEETVAEVEALRTEREAWDAAMTEKDGKIADLVELTSTGVSREHWEAQLAEKDAKITTLEETRLSVAEAKTLGAAVVQKCDEVAALQDKLATIESNQEKWEAEAAEKDAKIATLQETVRESAHKDDKIVYLLEELTAKEAAFDDARERCEALEARVATLSAQLESRDAELASLQAQQTASDLLSALTEFPAGGHPVESVLEPQLRTLPAAEAGALFSVPRGLDLVSLPSSGSEGQPRDSSEDNWSMVDERPSWRRRQRPPRPDGAEEPPAGDASLTTPAGDGWGWSTGEEEDEGAPAGMPSGQWGWDEDAGWPRDDQPPSEALQLGNTEMVTEQWSVLNFENSSLKADLAGSMTDLMELQAKLDATEAQRADAACRLEQEQKLRAGAQEQKLRRLGAETDRLEREVDALKAAGVGEPPAEAPSAEQGSACGGQQPMSSDQQQQQQQDRPVAPPRAEGTLYYDQSQPQFAGYFGQEQQTTGAFFDQGQIGADAGFGQQEYYGQSQQTIGSYAAGDDQQPTGSCFGNGQQPTGPVQDLGPQQYAGNYFGDGLQPTESHFGEDQQRIGQGEQQTGSHFGHGQPSVEEYKYEAAVAENLQTTGDYFSRDQQQTDFSYSQHQQHATQHFDLQQQPQALQQQLQAALQERQQLQERLQGLEPAADQLQAALQERQELQEKLQALEPAANQQLHAALQERQELQERLQGLEPTADQLQAALQERQELQERLQALEPTADQQLQLKLALQERDELRLRVRELEPAVEQLRAAVVERELVERELEDARRQLETAHHGLEQAESDASHRLNIQALESETRIEQLELRVADLEPLATQREETECQRQQLQEQLTAAELELVARQERLASLGADKERLERSVADLTARLAAPLPVAPAVDEPVVQAVSHVFAEAPPAAPPASALPFASALFGGSQPMASSAGFLDSFGIIPNTPPQPPPPPAVEKTPNLAEDIAEQLSLLRAENEQLRARIIELTPGGERSQQLEAEVSQLKEQRTADEERRLRLETELEERNARLLALAATEEQLKSSESEIALLRAQLDTVAGQGERSDLVEADNAQLHSQLEELTATARAAQQLEEENVRLRTEAAAEVAAGRRLQEQLHQAQEEAARLREEVDRLQQCRASEAAADAAQRAAGLEHEVTRLGALLEAAAAEKAALQAAGAGPEAAPQQAGEASTDDLQRQLTEAEEARAALQAEKAAAEAELESTKAQLQQYIDYYQYYAAYYSQGQQQPEQGQVAAQAEVEQYHDPSQAEQQGWVTDASVMLHYPISAEGEAAPEPSAPPTSAELSTVSLLSSPAPADETPVPADAAAVTETVVSAAQSVIPSVLSFFGGGGGVSSDAGEQANLSALRSENEALRGRVAELERAAAAGQAAPDPLVALTSSPFLEEAGAAPLRAEWGWEEFTPSLEAVSPAPAEPRAPPPAEPAELERVTAELRAEREKVARLEQEATALWAQTAAVDTDKLADVVRELQTEREKLSRLQVEATELREHAAAAAAGVERLALVTAELDAEREEARRLREEILALQGEMAVLRDQLAQPSTQLEAERAARAAPVADDAAQLSAQLAEELATVSQLSGELESERADVARLEGEVQLLRDLLTDTQAQLSAARSTPVADSALGDQAAFYRQKVTELETTLAGSREELQQAKVKNGRLLQKLKTAQKGARAPAPGADGLDAALLEELQAQATEARRRADEAERLGRELQQEKTRLAEQVDTYQDAQARLVDAKERLETEAHALRVENDRLRGQITDMEWRLAELEEAAESRAAAGVTPDAAGVTSDAAGVTSDPAGAAQSEVTAEADSAARSELARLAEEKAVLERRLEELELRNEELLELYETAAAAPDAQLQRSVEQLQVALDAAASENAALSNRLAAYESQWLAEGGGDASATAHLFHANATTSLQSPPLTGADPTAPAPPPMVTSFAAALSSAPTDVCQSSLTGADPAMPAHPLYSQPPLAGATPAATAAPAPPDLTGGAPADHPAPPAEADPAASADTDLAAAQAEADESGLVLRSREVIIHSMADEISSLRATNAALLAEAAQWRTLAEEGEDGDVVDGLNEHLRQLGEALQGRDARCRELTSEVAQLLEERDLLQLRLSSALRSNQAHQADVPRPADEAADVLQLKVKLAELKQLNYLLDIQLQDEVAERRRLQRSLQLPEGAQHGRPQMSLSPNTSDLVSSSSKDI
ncbi:rootletin-like [Pollicipes pollicipes]|uniref:rootletin-like n=1 Tax=Pollicipes pollicipes TaxID=41117 RepID=UPI001885024D|nr:rootletin-like [Pollicipes pollicipes]